MIERFSVQTGKRLALQLRTGFSVRVMAMLLGIMGAMVKSLVASVTFAFVIVASLSMVSDAKAGASLVADVDISSQTMTVSRNGAVVDRWKVSTAGKGYRTPTGRYRPTRMHRMWYSKKYDNSPMPFSIFFRGGYAIHGTGSIRRLGSPASHGCIRLHPRDAAKLYAMVEQAGPRNTSIVITR